MIYQTEVLIFLPYVQGYFLQFEAYCLTTVNFPMRKYIVTTFPVESCVLSPVLVTGGVGWGEPVRGWGLTGWRGVVRGRREGPVFQ